MNSNVKKLTLTAIFSAISTVLMLLFEFPIPFFPPFLKLDLADIPSLIVAFVQGPISGIITVIIRNLINAPFSASGGVGEIANAIVGIAFVGTAGLIYKKKRTVSGAVFSLLFGTIAMGVISIFSNYYIIIPFYSKFMPIDAIISLCKKTIPFVKTPFEASVFVFMPFTLIKGVIVSLITFFIYKPIRKIIN